jgi:hypothetical protein
MFIRYSTFRYIFDIRITDRIIVEKVLLLKMVGINEFERHWQNIYDKLD